jgi:hypothetical protein
MVLTLIMLLRVRTNRRHYNMVVRVGAHSSKLRSPEESCLYAAAKSGPILLKASAARAKSDWWSNVERMETDASACLRGSKRWSEYHWEMAKLGGARCYRFGRPVPLICRPPWLSCSVRCRCRAPSPTSRKCMWQSIRRIVSSLQVGSGKGTPSKNARPAHVDHRPP